MGFNSKYTGAEVEKLLDSIKDNALVESISWENIKDRPNSIEGYGIIDVYNKTEINNSLLKYVTLSTDQNITGIKSFINGFKLGDALITYNKDKKTFVFQGNLLVEGGIAWNSSIEGFEPKTITDAVMIDSRTLGRNENGEIYVKGGTGGSGGGSIEYPLTWSGYSSGSYDGSASKNIAIPSLLSQLTNDSDYITSTSVNSLLTDYLSKSGGVVSGDITATKFIGALEGNADSATKLATPRSIWGQSFDGTGNISGMAKFIFDNKQILIESEAGGYTEPGITFWNNGPHPGSISASLLLLNPKYNGNVAIGGTTADEKLHVHGNIKINGNFYGDIWRIIKDSTYDGTFIQSANYNGTNDLGNIYITARNGNDLTRFQVWAQDSLFKGNVTATKFIGDLQGNADSATLWSYNSPWVQDFDALNYSNNGLYHFDGDYANLVGKPPHYSWSYTVLNVGYNAGRRQQLAIPYDASKMFIRRNVDNNWSDWREFAFVDTDSLTPSSGILTVNGNLLATGEITQHSSLVLKDVVDTRFLTLKELEKLKPYSFYWKDKRDDKLHAGAVADYVMPILPEVISTDKDNIHSMNYANAAWVVGTSLTPYVSKHEEDIDWLKARVRYLEDKLKEC